MKFFRWLRNLFKQDKPKAPVETDTGINPPSGSMSDLIVGLVVGHNEKRQGADNYLKESEWVFNSRITRKLKERLNYLGIRSVIVFRPTSGGYNHECKSVANELEKNQVTHAICFHFNSAGKGARGCEVLIAETHTKEDDLFADEFTDILNEKYGFRERGKDGIKIVSSKHNGYGMINRINRKGIVTALIEPCFADYPTKESRLIFEQEDKYVLVLTSAIQNIWSKS